MLKKLNHLLFTVFVGRSLLFFRRHLRNDHIHQVTVQYLHIELLPMHPHYAFQKGTMVQF